MNYGKKFVYLLIAVLLIVSVCFCACGCSLLNISKNKDVNYNNYYNSLTKEEKSEFDSKLKEIKKSGYYKSLSNEDKSKLVEKFVESEKTLKEVANDPIDKTPEEIQQKIDELKTNGASEQEIESAEQEKAYWEVVFTVKTSTTNNVVFNFRNPGMTIRRINGLYKLHGLVFFNADFVKEEIIDGKFFYSKVNMLCGVPEIIDGNESYNEILAYIALCSIISNYKTCTNFNAESHKKFFEKDVLTVSYLDKLRNQGYEISCVQSWEEISDTHYPQFIVKAVNGTDEKMFLYEYNNDLERYARQAIQKICPEFWAQLEIENAKNK